MIHCPSLVKCIHCLSIHVNGLPWTQMQSQIREALLSAWQPYWGLDLNTVCLDNWHEFENFHLMVCCTLERYFLHGSLPCLHCMEKMAASRVWGWVGEWFAYVTVVENSCLWWWLGYCVDSIGNREWTKGGEIDGKLNVQAYHDDILGPIIPTVINHYHLIIQHDNTKPHFTRMCTITGS